MIPKEIMKRGGILSRLVHLYEESPYKPDTVNRWNFEREFTFARYFCPFLFTSKCQFNEL
jgi:hypothetical protein